MPGTVRIQIAAYDSSAGSPSDAACNNLGARVILECQKEALQAPLGLALEVSVKGKAAPDEIDPRLNICNARRHIMANGAGGAAASKQFS